MSYQFTANTVEIFLSGISIFFGNYSQVQDWMNSNSCPQEVLTDETARRLLI